MAKQYIYENTNYKVDIGAADLTEETAPVYKVINKITGMIELESHMLPTALFEADNLDAYITEHNEYQLRTAGPTH